MGSIRWWGLGGWLFCCGGVYQVFGVSLVGWCAGVAYLGGCYMGSFLCGMIWVLEDLFTTDLKESCEAYV